MSVPTMFQFKRTSAQVESMTPVRVVDVDGEPMFIASDIALVLGYQRSRDAIAQHCKGAVKRRLPTAGGEQDVTLIPERDVYRLVMRSRLPDAEQFEEWVVGEVLPSIRKSGSYGVALPDFADPVAAARAWADEAEAKRSAERALEQAKPAIAFVEKYVEAPAGNKTFRQVCKLLGANENRFREFLVDRSIVYYLNGEMTPFANHLDAERFSVKAGVSNHSEHAYNHMTFTPKGVTWIAGEWGKHIAELNQQAMQQRAAPAFSHARL
jgi:anti-repressor protein